MTTETNAPAALSPGRAACEAFWAAIGAGPDVQEPGAAWKWARSQNATGAWEAAAKAAAGAAEAKLAALRDLCREHGSTLTPGDVLRIIGEAAS